ncbi:hypothetical protein HMPREF3189_01509 [Clostridiales bacterium KA00134]|nr:hypothetical protein HMPREF3189_01509 [Clostridiales bacterium KA00134]
MAYLTKIKGRLSNLFSSFIRFPLPMLSVCIAAVFYIIEISSINANNNQEFRYFKLGCLFVFICALTAFLRLLSEGLTYNISYEEYRVRNFKISIIAYILAIPVIFGVYKLLFEANVYMPNYKYFGSLILFAIGCFYIGKISYHEDYIAYVMEILYSLVTSIVYSLVVYIGICAIYFAANKLLGLSFSRNFYEKAAIIAFLPFAGAVFLSGFPTNSRSLNDYNFPKVLKVLFTYIILPIFSVYMGILYLYFGKILIQRDLPQNIITNLVLWFEIFLILFNFFISHIKDVKILEKFRRLSPILSLPLLGMMFFSMWLRVSQYGFTINRYFVLMMGVFVFLANLYLTIYKKSSNIALPIIFTILLSVSLFGPLSAEAVSLDSQANRLMKALERNNMVNGGKIIPNTEISKNDKEIILSSLEYLNRNDEMSAIKVLPENFKMADVEEVFGFQRVGVNCGLGNKPIYYDLNSGDFTLNVDGYTKLTHIMISNDTSVAYAYGALRFICKNNKLNIYKIVDEKPDTIAEIDINQLKNRVKAFKEANSKISPEDLEIKGDYENMKYKLIFDHLSISEDLQDYNLYFYFLTDR